MLVARSLRKQFGARVAVDGVSFEIAPGEIYGLLGPNGAGKTTTIPLLSGIVPRDAGEIVIDGIDLDAGPPARARLGLVPQNLTLYPDLSGRENLRFWGRLYDLRGAALDEAVTRALAAVQLVERADERVAVYSGGMARRLNLAAGILHRPAVLVLDEPTVGLDPRPRHRLWRPFRVWAAEGTTLLVSTHVMDEAARTDRLAFLLDGRVVAEATPAEMLARTGAADLEDAVLRLSEGVPPAGVEGALP